MRYDNLTRHIPKEKETGEQCPECGSPLVLRGGRYGNFIACSNYPMCKYIKEDENKKIIKMCPECGGELKEQVSKRGLKYIGCSNYPNCKYAEWNDKKDDKDITDNEEIKEKQELYSSQFKKGKRDDIDDDVMSSWEANISRLFNYLDIDYKYESDSYQLNQLRSKYKFMSPSYLPDYTLSDGTLVEVKGRLDSRSLENMKAFKELYPDEKIKIIDNDIYYLINQKYSEIVPNWEKTNNTLMSDIDVVGIKIKERIPYVENLNVGDELIIEREIDNQYDKNAIKVFDINKNHIGYIDGLHACYLAPKMDIGISYTIKIKEKKENALKCTIKSNNLDEINVTEFWDLL